MMTWMMFIVSALLGVARADEPTGCGTGGDEVCVDNDGDGFNENATDDPKKDCDDTLDYVHPGASIAIGDEDTDCNGTDDEDELEQALDAACGPDPEDASKTLCDSDDDAVAEEAQARRDGLKYLIENCADSAYETERGSFVWRYLPGRGYACDNLPADMEWRRAEGVESRADKVIRRRLGRAESSATEALVILRGDDGTGGLVVEIDGLKKTVYGVDTDDDGIIDIQGLDDRVGQLEDYMYLGIDITGDGKVDKKGVLARLGDLERQVETLNTQVGNLTLEMYGPDRLSDNLGGIDGEVAGLQRDVRGLSLLKSSGFSMGNSATLLYSALPGFPAEVCMEVNAAGECKQLVDRSIRDQGFIAYGLGAYISYVLDLDSWDFRYTFAGSLARTQESGDDADGESVRYKGMYGEGTATALVRPPGWGEWKVPVSGGLTLGMCGHNTARTEVDSRVNGTCYIGGGAFRFDFPFRGYFAESAIDLSLRWSWENFGTVVTDAAGSRTALDGAGAPMLGINWSVGIAPFGHTETN